MEAVERGSFTFRRFEKNLCFLGIWRNLKFFSMFFGRIVFLGSLVCIPEVGSVV